MKELQSIIDTWKDPEDDLTGNQLLTDDINEFLHGKKTFHDMSIMGQMCIAEAKEMQGEHNNIINSPLAQEAKRDLMEGASKW